jgi:hypothetical protein
MTIFYEYLEVISRKTKEVKVRLDITNMRKDRVMKADKQLRKNLSPNDFQVKYSSTFKPKPPIIKNF